MDQSHNTFGWKMAHVLHTFEDWFTLGPLIWIYVYPMSLQTYSHQVEIEVSRCPHIPLEERSCQLDHQGVETTKQCLSLYYFLRMLWPITQGNGLWGHKRWLGLFFLKLEVQGEVVGQQYNHISSSTKIIRTFCSHITPTHATNQLKITLVGSCLVIIDRAITISRARMPWTHGPWSHHRCRLQIKV